MKKSLPTNQEVPVTIPDSPVDFSLMGNYLILIYGLGISVFCVLCPFCHVSLEEAPDLTDHMSGESLQLSL